MTDFGFDPAPLLANYRGIDDGTVAEFLGVTRRTINRWRNGHSRLPRFTADELACRYLRLHPAELWPEWGDAA